MIHINLVCIGKIKEDYLKNAITEYSKRLSKYCKLNIIELNDEAISYMYKPIEIAPDRTYGSIVDTLIEKLSKLVK